MEKYTLEDIETLIEIMEQSQLIRTMNITKYIPVVGIKLYRRALFEQTKINEFRDRLKGARLGSTEEQQKFIDAFSPVLEQLHFPSQSDRKTNKKELIKNIRR